MSTKLSIPELALLDKLINHLMVVEITARERERERERALFWIYLQLMKLMTSCELKTKLVVCFFL